MNAQVFVTNVERLFFVQIQDGLPPKESISRLVQLKQRNAKIYIPRNTMQKPERSFFRNTVNP